jgi:hypothetical protein
MELFDEQKWNAIDFLEATWKFEDECQAKTNATLPTLGKKAIETLPAIGRLLSYLDAAFSCVWGCPGGDHAIERLVFRSTNRTRAAVRLMRFGFYDECLMLCRANGETANLLSLFTVRPTALSDWKNKERWTRTPVEVRKALEESGSMVPIEEGRYRSLSGIAAHNDPDCAPAAHNVFEKPVSGGYFQPEGAILCQNEMSLPLIFTALTVPKLIGLPSTFAMALLTAAAFLVNSTGGFDVKSQNEYWKVARENLTKAIKEAQKNEPPNS